MPRIARILPAALLLVLPAARADEILLNNGRTLEGAVRVDGEMVVFERPGIRMEIRRDEVKEIRRSPTAQEQYAEKAKALEAAKPDAEAHHRLGLWAEGKGLKDEARRSQEKALALDADHAGARRALGYIKVDGKWRLEEEVMKERGLVRAGGRWVTPEEAARIAAGVREVSPKEKARLEAKERDRLLRRSLNGALRRLADASPGVRALGEQDLLAVAKEMGDPDLEAKVPEVRAYYDRVYEEIERSRALIQVHATIATLKRPIPKFTTSLGAFTSPVTLQLPEISIISINTTAVVPLEVDEAE